MGQLNQTPLNADDRKAAELIIGNIDDTAFSKAAGRNGPQLRHSEGGF